MGGSICGSPDDHVIVSETTNLLQKMLLQYTYPSNHSTVTSRVYNGSPWLVTSRQLHSIIIRPPQSLPGLLHRPASDGPVLLPLPVPGSSARRGCMPAVAHQLASLLL